MMIDLKPNIRQALLNNAALVSLLGGKYVYPQVSPDASIQSYVTFFEIGNTDDRYAENQAFNSEIRFQFDVWTPGNTGPIAAEVNRTLEDMEFIRTNSLDDFDEVSHSYRKILRYKTIKFRS